jgi:hypothetical protein
VGSIFQVLGVSSSWTMEASPRRMVHVDGKHASWCSSMTESGRRPTDNWQDYDYLPALVPLVGKMDAGVLRVTSERSHSAHP